MWTRKAVIVCAVGLLAGAVGLALANVNLAVFSLAAFAYLGVGTIVPRHPTLAGQKQASTERLFEEESMDVGIEIRNAGRRTGLLELRDRLPEEMKLARSTNHGLLSLKAGQAVEWKYAAQTPIKGAYPIGPLEYRLHGPFDLFAREGQVPLTEKYVTVYPKRERLASLFIRSFYPKPFLGANPVRQPGYGSEFYSLREYQFGDRMKDINWKASARASAGREDDLLIVNQPERESIADVFIILDARAAMAAGAADRNAFIWGCRAAATLASFLINRRDRVGLTMYGDDVLYVHPNVGEQHLYSMFGALATIDAAGRTPMQYTIEQVLPRITPSSPVIIISSLEGDSTVFQAVSSLRVHKTEVTVLSPSTPDFAYEAGLVDEYTYRMMRLERAVTLAELRSYGVNVLDWTPEKTLERVLLEMVR